jgi:oligopeptide/dipeptide ABC transporter ATP-binding protein
MRALACEPDLIVLDEPTSALDVSVQAQVLRTLKDVQAATSIAYILISHDVGVIRAMCDRIVIMYLGRVVEEGPARAVFDSPQHPYTRALIDAAPRVRRQIEAPFVLDGDISARGVKASECPLRRRCPLAVDDCARMPPVTQAGPGHFVSCWRRGAAGSHSSITRANEREPR